MGRRQTGELDRNMEGQRIHGISGYAHVTGCWILKYICKSRKKAIHIEDIPSIRDIDKSKYRCEVLKRMLEARAKRKPPSLLSALFHSAKGTLIPAIILTYISECLKFSLPFLIGTLVAHFEGDDISRIKAYTCAGVLIVVNVLFSCIFSTYSFLYQYVAMQMRTASVSIILQKVLRLKISYTEDVDSGFILNLLTADTERFHTALVTFQGLVAGPVSLLALFILLAIRLGLSVTPSFIFVLLLFVVRMLMGRCIGRLRGSIGHWTDKRLQLIAESMKSMKIVKMQCWEDRLLKKASIFRRNEMTLLLRQMIYLSVNVVLGAIGIKTTIAMILVTHYLLQGTITPQLVVEVITWVQLSDYILFTMFPLSMSAFYQLVESVKRIQFFLETDEISNSVNETTPYRQGVESEKEIRIAFKHVEANWKCVEPREANSPPSTQSPSSYVSGMKRSPTPRPNSSMMVTSPTPIGTPIIFPISPLLLTPSGMAQSMMSHPLSLPVTPMSDLSSECMFPSLEDPIESQPILSDVSLNVSKSELVVILGGVGAGKTSLLMAVLGFLPISRGNLKVEGNVAYVPQESWLINATIEENILLGKVMEPHRYKEIIKACQLEEDLLILPYGDKTIIAESDTCLSGGQKSRINLARAVYQDADIYLLDDPISALDVHVGKKVFESVICGLLKDKCRLLVTHQINVIQGVKRVIILEDGRITESGSYMDVAQRIDLHRTISVDSRISSSSSHTGSKWSLLRVAFRLASPNVSRMSSTSTFHEEPMPDYQRKSHVNSNASRYQQIELLTEPNQRVVDRSIYLWYLKAGFGQVLLPLIYVTTLGTMVASIYADLFVTKWAEDLTFAQHKFNNTSNIITGKDANSTSMYIYLGVVGSFIAGCLVESCIVAGMVWLSAKNIYRKLQTSVFNTQMKFFEKNTLGSILNRFSRDSTCVDERFILPIFLTVGLSCSIFAYLAYAMFVNILVVAATIPFVVVTLLARQFTIYAIRDFKRLEAKLKAPVLAHMSTILDGIPVIRAFKLEEYMSNGANQLIDDHTKAWYCYLSSQRWLQLLLLMLTTVYLAMVVFLGLMFPTKGMGSGALGLSLTYIITMMIQIQELMKWTTELESQMTSVERIKSFSKLERDGVNNSNGTPSNWPSTGEIKFKNLTLTYSNMNTPTLVNLNFTIAPREKVGVVGRTGAGKSSLFLALLRIQETQGNITIDGINVKDLDIKQLRQSISVIPQDPVLMSGKLRETLDPSSAIPDKDIWEALEKVQMKERIEELPDGLDFEISDGGYDLSVGQRQLLCLARALLRNSKIVIIDEATANIDDRTVAQIDQTFQNQMRNCTVLNIAHRLDTIIGYDRIMVLDEGHLVEFKHPHLLLQNPSGVFYRMVQDTGKDSAARLSRKAYLSYKRKQPTS